MDSLEAELERARDLSVADLADAVEAIGFECTRCGACCKGYVEGECGDVTDADGGSGKHADGGSGEHADGGSGEHAD
ncbi:MAG: YkgJ family cysteine cluster protein, partial [Haloferacaceae archaeon]